MKRLFYPRLALDSIRKKRRLYFPYILTGCVMIMMYYILSFLLESPALAVMEGSTTLRSLFPMGLMVIALFSLLFLFYSHTFLMKQRYREFGLYNMLGMDKRNIGRLMLWETAFTALLAILGGLLLGLAFSKAAELVLMNLLGMPVNYDLSIGVSSMLKTALLYAGIYLLLLFSALLRVAASQPLEMMQRSKAGEKKLKGSWFFALLGVLLLICAYSLSLSIEEPLLALFSFFVAVIMVILGTYLLFISGSVFFLRVLKSHKKYYYQPHHFVSISSMIYRMKRNGAGLASICILLTMVLVMLSSCTTLYFGEENAINNRYPYGINITYTFEGIQGLSEEKLDEERKIIAGYAPESADLTGIRYARAAGQFTGEGMILDYTHAERVDASHVGYLYILSLDDYNRMTGENKSLGANECMLYSSRMEESWDTFAMEFCAPYRVTEYLHDFWEDSRALVLTMPSVYMIVSEVSALTAPLNGMKNESGYSLIEYEWSLGFDCDPAQEEDIMNAMTQAFSLHAAGASWKKAVTESREAERDSFYELYGSLFFLGILLSVVFLLAAVLIIYYKQLSEGYEDQGRFEIMQKVGMTKKDIKKSINSQMLTVFFLPLVMAGLHLAFAFPFISRILTVFAFHDTALNAFVTLISFLIFGALYTIVYRLTSGSYYAIVSGGKAPQ